MHSAGFPLQVHPDLEPVVQQVAEEVVAGLPRGVEIDAVSQFGQVFAARAAIRWLGWDPALEQTVLEWVAANHAAARAGDRQSLGAVALSFDAIVASQVTPRRHHPQHDVTSELMADTSAGRPLTDAEVVSILRNWTGGDIASVALCLGVVLHGLATTPGLLTRVRQGSDDEAAAIIDELLRLDSPFVTNRRRATCPVQLGPAQVQAGDRVLIHWTSANRDQRTFGASFDEVAHADGNLVYGIGPHVCPGRALATMELRVAVQTLVRSTDLSLAGPGQREVHPVGGWATLPVILSSPVTN